MKTKMSKRLFSGLLAALMLFTMIPFTATAGTDQELAALKTAITAYQDTMKKGIVYNNVAAGYNAYITAKQYADAYEYGEYTVADLSAATANLTAATQNLTKFEGRTGNFTATFSGETESEFAAGYSKNLLYAAQSNFNTVTASIKDEDTKRIEWQLFYTPTVMLYDGQTTPERPAMYRFRVTGKFAGGQKERRTFAIYPVNAVDSYDDSSEFSVPDFWWGGTGTTPDFGWNILEFNIDTANKYPESTWGKTVSHIGHNAATGGFMKTTNKNASVELKSSSTGLTESAWRIASSSVRFTDTLSNTDISKTYNPIWHVSTGGKSDEDNPISGGGADRFWNTSTAAFYVINYEALMNALQKYTPFFAEIGEYDNNWRDVQAFMNAIEAAMAFDPNEVDYASDISAGVSACAATITNHINNLASKSAISKPGTNDPYKALRTEITNSRTPYNDKDEYTEESFDVFLEAFEEAKEAMRDVYSNGYNASYNAKTIQQIRDNLYNARRALKTVVRLADTTEIVDVIEDAEEILKFTCQNPEDSTDLDNDEGYIKVYDIERIEAALADAYDTFVDGNINGLTKYTEDEQDELDVFTAALREAITGVKLNVAKFQKLIDEAARKDLSTVFDVKAFEAARDAADEAMKIAKVAVLTVDNIATVTQSYQEAYDALRAALDYANHPYEEQRDAVIVYGKPEITINNSFGKNNVVQYTSPTGIVLVKTTRDEYTFTDVGKYSFSASTTNKFSQMIYEFGLNVNDVALSTGYFAANYNFELVDFDNVDIIQKDGEENKAGAIYCDGVPAVSTAREGLTDGKTETYWWFKDDGNGNHRFTKEATLQFRAPSMNLATAPTINTYGVREDGTPLIYSYFYGYWKSGSSSIGYNYDEYRGATATPMDVTVVDISSLYSWLKDDEVIENSGIYGVPHYTAINAEHDNMYYTEESFQNLMDAVLASNFVTNKDAIKTYESPEAYRNACVVAFNNLRTAINSLVVAKYNVNFSYKDESGKEVVFKGAENAEHGTALKLPTNIPTYTDDTTKYTFKGWKLDGTLLEGENAPSTVVGNVTYVAEYNEEPNVADFSKLDAAVANLKASLEDDIYLVEDLEALDTTIANELYYYNLSDDERQEVYATKQNLIDEEIEGVNALITALEAANIDLSAAQASIDQFDPDAYEVDVDLYTRVSVDGKMVRGINYATQEALDADIAKSITPIMYEVTLNGGEPIGSFPYGTTLVVHGNGEFEVNPDTEHENDGVNYAWYYKYKSKQSEQKNEKYMLTAPSYGFIVKGNTTLRTELAEAEEETSYVVTFVNGINGRVFDIAYTTGTMTMPAAPDCPYYKFTGYDNGLAAGTEFEVTEDITIVANYEIDDIEKYDIKVTDTKNKISVNDSFSYNDRITASDPSAYVWISYDGYDPETWQVFYRVIAYGTELSFCANNDIEVEALKYSDFVDFLEQTEYYKFCDLDGNRVSSITREGIIKADTKFSMIGQFAVPEGAKVLEYGVIYTKEILEDGKTLDFVSAGEDDTIYRLKGSKHVSGYDDYGQYVISIKSSALSGDYTFTYRSYVTYSIDDVSYTHYADEAFVENVRF